MIQRRRHDIEKCAFNNCDGRKEILSVEVSINKETWLFNSTRQVTRAPRLSLSRNTIMNFQTGKRYKTIRHC